LQRALTVLCNRQWYLVILEAHLDKFDRLSSYKGVEMDWTDTASSIRGNSVKSILIVVAFPFVLPTLLFGMTLVVASLGGRPDALALSQRTFFVSLGVMVAITVAWLPVGYFLNQWIIDHATGARLVSRAEHRSVWAILDRLSAKCGIRTPALRLIETDALNAYASGLTQGSYCVTVTSGLLEDEELEGVLAHELTHIVHQDVQLMVIAGVLVGVVPLVHDVAMKAFWALIMGFLGLMRAVFTILPSPGAKLLGELTYGGFYWVVRIAAYGVGLVATMTSLILQFALSRRREFMADAGAVAMTGNPGALLSALRKISGNATLDTPLAAVKAMCIENGESWFGLFATHPPISDRIAALVKLSTDPRAELPRSPRITMEPRGPSVPMREQDRPESPTIDPATVQRYRSLLGRGSPERLDVIGREHLYRRVRESLEHAKTQNAALTDTEIAVARAHLEAAIEEIEADIARVH
jgi:heat shock protein HtpX